MFKPENIGIKNQTQLINLLHETEQNPFCFFLPNGPQAELIKTIGETVPKKRIILVTSGNGTGKSACVINIVPNIVYGDSNFFRNIRDVETGKIISGFFDYPLYKNYPKDWPKHIWYVSNKDSLKGLWEEFKKWIPETLYKATKGGKTYISEVFFKGTDWKLSFKTVDQDPGTFESANISLCIFDEPPPLVLYRAAIARLRAGGFIIIPATPLFGSAWFVDEIIDKVEDDGDKYHQTVSIWENCVETSGSWDLGPDLGKHPKGCLFKKNIDFMVRNFDIDEREAREKGKFQHLTGLVYKTYVRDTRHGEPGHFKKIGTPHFPESFVYQFILDPHDRRPPAACWIRIDKWGRKRVIREWPSVYDSVYQGRPFNEIKSADPYVIKDFVRMWIDIEVNLRIPNDRLQSIIDPNFGRKPNSVTGLMMHEEYSNEFDKQGRGRGFITDANDDLATGHKAVKDLLQPTTSGDQYLLIDRSCVNMDKGFRSYSYDEWRGKTAEGKSISERVKTDYKDFPDLIRYAAVVPIEWWPFEDREVSDKDDYDYGTMDKDEAIPEGVV